MPTHEPKAVRARGPDSDRRRGEDLLTDVTRNPVDHLSFGYGTHTCAGQALARIEAQSVLVAPAKRVRRFHIGEPGRSGGRSARSYRRSASAPAELSRGAGRPPAAARPQAHRDLLGSG
ncbi:MAG: hypothetical protein EKK42_08230 [Pseudonocardiaceae bacterium]|nr:MAG: hypothetical protein EKK42_08230 [Pseudonocardiaceae bacterium]